MEPHLHGYQTTNDAAAPSATAFFDIPFDPADDDDVLATLPESQDAPDVWSGVEAPQEEASPMIPEMVASAPRTDSSPSPQPVPSESENAPVALASSQFERRDIRSELPNQRVATPAPRTDFSRTPETVPSQAENSSVALASSQCERRDIRSESQSNQPVASSLRINSSPSNETVRNADPAHAATRFPSNEDVPEDSNEVASLGEEDPEEVDAPPERGGWLVAFLCAGVSIIAVCLLLPLAEENHQLAWQREKLKTDLAQLQEQVQVNDEFLKKISNDPTLAERLAQRQMKFIRQGTTILDLPGGGKEEMSPFQLVTLPPPNPIPPYQPLGGVFSAVIRNSHLRLYLTGVGLLLLAAGLVLGGESKQTYDPT